MGQHTFIVLNILTSASPILICHIPALNQLPWGILASLNRIILTELTDSTAKTIFVKAATVTCY